MTSQDIANSPVVSLANLPATAQQRRSVFTVAALLAAAFAAIAPFSATPLPQSNAFIPTFEAIIFVNDLITSVLLFAQYAIVASTAVLVLAGGYLFTALIVIPHALSFPGAFSPTGLLAIGHQTTAWLFFLWHLGSAVAVLAFAYLKDADRSNGQKRNARPSEIVWTVAIVCALVFSVTWGVTAGDRFLPVIFEDETRLNWSNSAIVAVSVMSMAAIALVALWSRRRSVLDYWLMLMLWTLILEQCLTAVLNSARFSLGFYAGRMFSLGTSLVILILLLGEVTKLYTSLARSHLMLARERNNKLLNVGATAAAIAHELKQPLAAMVANADASLGFLEQTPPNLIQVKEALNDIVADGYHASDALDGVRTLFRTVNQEREPVDVNELVGEVLHSMRNELNEHGVTIQSQLAPGVPPIQGNRGQLQQVIFNLTHNAIEAMIGATGRSRVLRLVTRLQDRDRIVIAVQDTGPGIAPKRLDEIFDAFMTTKPQGTGLGLAICRVIIERHGGELTAFSDGKNGALFQFSLPIERAEDRDKISGKTTGLNEPIR